MFDRTVVSRIWDFVRPYRRQLIISVIAVLIFTATQIAIPLIISYAIDNGLLAGPDGQAAMRTAMMAFGLAITMNYGAAWVQESVVGKAAENVLFDIRTAMFAICRTCRSASWTRPKWAA